MIDGKDTVAQVMLSQPFDARGNGLRENSLAYLPDTADARWGQSLLALPGRRSARGNRAQGVGGAGVYWQASMPQPCLLPR